MTTRGRTTAAVLAGVAIAAILLVVGCESETPEKLLASAQGYLTNGDHDAAVIQIKRALDKAPGNAEARFLMGQALLDGGDPAAAETELQKALELGASLDKVLPSLARAMLQTGQGARIVAQFASTTLQTSTAIADLKTSLAAAYARQGDTESAGDSIDAALQAVPMYPPAVMVQARMKATAGETDDALSLLDGLLAKDHGNEQVGVAKGYLLWLGKHDATAAMDAHRKVLAANPKSVAAQSEIVTLLFAQGRRAEARQEFEKLRKIAPKHPQTVFFDAQFAYVDRQFKRAREIIDALLKTVPNHYRALELAAAAEYHQGNDEQVQAFAAQALKVAPRLVLARQILAQSYLRSGQAAKAVEAVAPLLQGERPDAESLALAGAAYMQSGDVGRAEAAFRRAKQLAPDSSKVRTAAAMADLSGGRADIALQELQAIAADDKGGARADLALISALISQGDMKGALKATAGLQTKLPESPLPLQLRGQVQVSLRDAAGARSSFESALAKDAKYFPALAALASMDMATGKADGARARVTAFIEAHPTNARAAMLLADIAQASGAPAEEVMRLQTQAVRADRTDAEAHLALIRRHVQFGDQRGALSAAQAAAAALPNDPRIHVSLGQIHLQVGDAPQALTTIKKLTSTSPPSAPMQMALAEAYLATNDTDGARRALKKALEIDADFDDARRSLAMLAIQERRPDDAIAIAREMQKRRPNGALGYSTEGDVEVNRKHWAQAAAAYRAALRYTQASEAAIKLHTTLRAAGRAPEADRWAVEWEKKRPNDPAFRFYLGDVAMSQKDYATAETQYRATLAVQPNNAYALNNVAWLLHKQSKPGALDLAQKANAALPNRAPLLDTMATIQAAHGKLDDAIATQRRAVTASPQDPNLKLALARYLLKGQKRDEARDLLDALARLGDKFSGQAEVAALRSAL